MTTFAEIVPPLCEVCGVALPEDRLGTGTCSRGCRGVLRRIEHASETGDQAKLESAIAAGAAIRAEKADALREQNRALLEELRVGRSALDASC